MIRMGRYENRPRPILDAIKGGKWKVLLGTALAAAVSFGLLNTDQSTATMNIVAALVTATTALTAGWAQFHVLDHAEPKVTPVTAPRDTANHPLVPRLHTPRHGTLDTGTADDP